ncbi:DNA starvation/stationary phase protection protein [Erythrobacter sp. HI0063]|uniref:Dps family protein n=1 Tax=unclassified Erythrobacter TaxID=2633097 RepID=UPI0007C38677|nr:MULTISPECIES: DNA starvation/stationary phase protection protein [unclassified Erythrobacter]KZY58136.1 DNA starvation/stationary phase protection protein [Erythrobacter sp. HI0063]MBO9511364.1 DNA starvation/stationary phase protection protein [Erythrobacter sp. A6_0]
MADIGNNSKTALVTALNGALADTLALYLKTKNFHWHIAGPRFRDLHLLFDEQAAQLLGTVDDIGERVRKNDEYTLTSIGSVAKQTRIEDQDDVTITPDAMVIELRDGNKLLHKRLKEVKEAAEEAGDNATSGIVDDWADQCEERIWFLNQTSK